MENGHDCPQEDYFMGQSYRDLIAWQKAMDFVMDVYRTSKAFPRDELYGLASQSGEQRLEFLPTLPKGKPVSRPTNSTISWRGREDRWSKLKPS